jgi:hypothetical protein
MSMHENSERPYVSVPVDTDFEVRSTNAMCVNQSEMNLFIRSGNTQ